jgi:hypothetical protein
MAVWAQYEQEVLVLQPVERAVWEQATEGLAYPLKPDRARDEGKGAIHPGGIPVELVRLMMQILIGVLLVLGLYLVLRSWLRNPVNRRIKAGGVLGMSLEDIEDRFQDLSLGGYIQAAVAREDYRLAVRLYYLAVLQGLTQGGYIRWSREKTNLGYQAELPEGALRERFRVLTVEFERAWYGEGRVSREDYERIAAGMEGMLLDVGGVVNAD